VRIRIRQQELLAELGVLALQGTTFNGMLNHTARMTAEGLSAEYCKVMEYMPLNSGSWCARASAGTKGWSATRRSAPSSVVFCAVDPGQDALVEYCDYLHWVSA